MKIIDKILLTQDLTSTSNEVTKASLEIAQIFGSKVIPIHVLPDDLVNSKVKTLLHNTALEKLQDITKTLQSHNIEVENPIVEYGSPWDVITKTANKINANLILVGSGDHDQKDNFQLGTTTERIIQKSAKPVLVVKHNTDLKVKKILCPIDFSDSSRRALSNAIVIARRFEAKLYVLSVCEVQSSWIGSKQDLKIENEYRCNQNLKEFNSFLEKFNFIDVDWHKEHRQGKPAQEILAFAAKESIDFLVMGTTSRTGLNRLMMGSVTEKVIREVPCSFMTLKSKDVINLQLSTDIKDFEYLFNTAEQLVKDGFYEEAIEYYNNCLNINNMNVPVYLSLAKVYDKLSEPEKAKQYRKSAQEIKERLWYSKIEDEVRKLRGSV